MARRPTSARMRVVSGTEPLTRRPRRSVVTVGMFDGVHLGHRRLIATAVRMAKQARATSVVVTFDPDPQGVLNPSRVSPPIMPLDERLRLIKELGADMVWVIPFTKTFARISAEQFVCEFLIDRLRACGIVVGETFAFGSDRRGTPQLLQTLGRRHHIDVAIVPSVRREGGPVSSSRIRRFIESADLASAQRLLGRPVDLWGRVVRGEGRGRLLGFPTANVRLGCEPLLPRGVYRVWLESSRARFQGLLNLGVCPTFSNGTSTLKCEVYLPGYCGNLYGRSVRIGVLSRIRGEQRFETPEALIRQIHRDLAVSDLKPFGAPRISV